MDNETYVKNRIQELVRLIKVARVYRQDNVPSLIQQVPPQNNHPSLVFFFFCVEPIDSLILF